jgi:hypothetical protein
VKSGANVLNKNYSTFFYIFLILLIVSTTVQPARAQVVHENPINVRPSNSMGVEDQIMLLLDFMQVQIQDVSVQLKEGNYTNARVSYTYLNDSLDVYQELLWRMNLSDSAYEAISGNLNFTRDELSRFIQNSELYDESYEQYSRSISTGNTSGANASARRARISYDQLTAPQG